MANCRVRYIDEKFKDYPALGERLTSKYHQIWKRVTSSKLFRKYGDNYLFSKGGTVQRAKQEQLIKKINQDFKTPSGQTVIARKPTISGFNDKILVNVIPLAQDEYNRVEGRQIELGFKNPTIKDDNLPEIEVQC